MIREMIQSEDEINKVLKVWLESVIQGHPFIPKSYWENEYNTVKQEYLPLSKTYVYTEDEQIKGFISMIGEIILEHYS